MIEAANWGGRTLGMNALRWSYLALLVVAAVCLAVFVLLPVNLEGWRGILLNLATEVFGILLTVAFIDSIIRRRQDRERRRYRSIALRQLRLPLLHHLMLLFNLYKASVERKPEKEIANVRDVFDADYFEQIGYLDFRKPGPVSPPMTWAEWVTAETRRFKNDVERVVDKYAIYLDPNTLDLAERLVGSHFMNIVNFFPTMIGMWQRRGFQVPANMLMGLSDEMREHTTVFCDLIEVYNAEVPDDRKVIFEEHMWHNNTEPLIGSGRVRIQPDDPDESTQDAE